MLEKGRELVGKDFPKTNWDLKRYMWLPQVGFRGLFKMTFFRHVTVLSGVGVGGGAGDGARRLPTMLATQRRTWALRHASAVRCSMMSSGSEFR